MNVLWCITGAGEYLKESVDILKGLKGHYTDIFVSRAGEEVLRNYGLLKDLKRGWNLNLDENYSAAKAGKVVLKAYDVVIVSPATANTVAKIANGMADNLVTTAVSLALKSGVPVYVVPTDWVAGKMKIPDFLTPGGTTIHMKPRKSDLRNIKYLEEEGIKVLEGPKDILNALK